MKNKFIIITAIIIVIISIIIPFVKGYSLDGKILIPTIVIAMLNSFIENKKIKYSIGIICLVVLLFVCYHWRY